MDVYLVVKGERGQGYAVEAAFPTARQANWGMHQFMDESRYDWDREPGSVPGLLARYEANDGLDYCHIIHTEMKV